MNLELLLLRHGESTFNSLRIHQGKEGSLSENGKQQAHLAVKKVSKYPIDRIISSDFPRALETALILSAALGKEVQILPAIGEVMTPSELHGRSHNDPDAIQIKKNLADRFHDSQWRYSDEEVFYETRLRAIAFLGFLEQLEPCTILVVTHGAFIKVVVSVMIFGKELTTYQYQNSFEKFGSVANTALSVHKFKDMSWETLVWNDQAIIPSVFTERE